MNGFQKRLYFGPIVSEQYEREHWFHKVCVNETLHRLMPGESSPYRRSINKIIQSLLQDKPVKSNVRLEVDSPFVYDLFEFDNIFKTTPVFKGIDTLKVYFMHTEDEDYQYGVVLDDEYDWSGYNPNELPLFKMQNNRVSVITLVIRDSLYNVRHIAGLIYHELTHAMHQIMNQNTTKLANIENMLTDSFYSLASDEADNRRPKYTSYGYYMQTIYGYIAEFTYYCQNTEIDAHLESAYAEYINPNMSINHVDVIELLRKPYDVSHMEIKRELPTLCTYTILYLVVKEFQDPVKLKSLQINYPESISTIMGILQKCSIYKHKTFEQCLLYWEAQLQKFLKKFADILMNLDIIDDEDEVYQ